MKDKIIKPEIGMGATIGVGSDSYPYTIHKVEDKKLWASEDNATMKPGLDIYHQDYNYSNDNINKPENWSLFTLRKDGEWHHGNSLKGRVLYIGHRRFYQDPSF